MTIEEMDEAVLKHAGKAGHPVVGITTYTDGSRRIAMEANEPAEVVRHIKDRTLRIYQRDEADPAYKFIIGRTDRGLTVEFPPVPDKDMPAYAEGILAAVDLLGYDWDAEVTLSPDVNGESGFGLTGVRAKDGG